MCTRWESSAAYEFKLLLAQLSLVIWWWFVHGKAISATLIYIYIYIYKYIYIYIKMGHILYIFQNETVIKL